MARRYDHSPEELKELAIQTGSDIIDELGFAKLSARGVATKMGYTVGTLYHLFGSLDLYIMHINGRTLDEWHEILSTKLAQDKKSDPVRCLVREYIHFSKSHRNRFLALFEHQLPDSIPVPQWYTPKLQRLFALVEEALVQSNVPARKAGHLAKVLWASIHGITILSLTGKLEVVGADSVEKLTETAVKSIVAL